MNPVYTQVLELQHNLIEAAHLAHWNVTGVDFYHFHLLFERVYETFAGKFDGMAEQVRGLGIEIPASIMNSVPELEWATPAELCGELCKVVKELDEALKRAREEAEEDKNYGLIAAIEDLLMECNTTCYLLESVNSKI
jgi:starvation-inducible DNA-binding protein